MPSTEQIDRLRRYLESLYGANGPLYSVYREQGHRNLNLKSSSESVRDKSQGDIEQGIQQFKRGFKPQASAVNNTPAPFPLEDPLYEQDITPPFHTGHRQVWEDAGEEVVVPSDFTHESPPRAAPRSLQEKTEQLRRIQEYMDFLLKHHPQLLEWLQSQQAG